MARRNNPLRRLERREARPASPHLYELRNAELADTWVKRVVQPLIDRLSVIGSRMSNKQMGDLLSRAGYPGGLSVQQLGGLRLLLMILLPLPTLLMAVAAKLIFGLSMLDAPMFILIGISSALAGYLSMPFILRYLVRKRQKEVTRQLPDVLDLITIAVEAGLGFDAAMDRVGNRYVGAMGDELVRTNNEIRMGRPWSEAMRDLGNRTGVEEVRSLVAALVQSRELGVNLANVLQAQSLRLREERARKAREQAQKTPTKIIFPLVGCIFPSLFIVLMGPAVLKAMKTLKESGAFAK